MLRRPARSLLTVRRSVPKTGACSFSSSSNGGKTPTLSNHFAFAAGFAHRVLFRTGLNKLFEYQEKGVFADTVGEVRHCMMFVQLHLPQRTNIDLLEFVEGAKMATEANLRAMNSVEFPEFLANKPRSSSEVADTIKQYTTPVHYNKMALQVKKNYLHRHFYIQCEGVEIEKAQLAKVAFARLTEKQYQDLVEFHKLSKGTASPEAIIEYLRLTVDVSTVENLDIVNLNGKTRHVQHQNVYRVAFESKVTDPEEVDWRIDSMHIIEQKEIPRTKEESATEKKIN
ncbi:hypothetical protein P3T76_005854 [Phytophthora citrophthora]|uniref:Uncharacterized protein n=1 Tax=Phytophthora citrophthora TaxID=4793 RepID=A0AAD9GPF4_9STRA|nr:hypothetical protein P3T76_005854 [Phytophthora citrophthora]